MAHDWDCIVVGGGAAGLSAALVLGRARRRTLVVDAGQQSNLPAHGIGGLLGFDGRPPSDLYAQGRAELATYPAVTVRSGTVVDGERLDPGFRLVLDGGAEVTSRTVLLATGMDYRYPDVPGLAARWGAGAFHCPFCHGWEVQDRPLGVLDPTDQGARRALLLRGWSDDVTLYSNGPTALAPHDRDELIAAGIGVEERPVVELLGPGRELERVRLVDGDERACGGLLVAVTLHQRSDLAARLGAAAAAPNQMAADALDLDEMLHTSAPGVLAAGDITGRMPSVVQAMATGSMAAAMLVHELVHDAVLGGAAATG